MRPRFAMLAVLAGCGSPPVGSIELVPELEYVETGPRWIAVDVDALATVRDGREAARLEVIADRVAIFEIDARELGAVSQHMHAKHHRCGGFTVHDTLDAARASLDVRHERAEVQYTIDNAATVAALLPVVSEASLLAVIQQLSAMPTRYYTSASGIAASTWLRDHWRGLAVGRADVTVELFAHDWPQSSVIATIEGTTRPDEIVVLGGHLDSITQGGGNAPGADDDASGIATLSEVLRVLMASGFRPERTVKFIAYAAEEVGLRGSTEIANEHESLGLNVVGALQLDMTNYQGSSGDIYILQDYTSSAQNAFVGQLIDAYLPGVVRGTTACGYACSDHASWYRAGYRVSMTAEARVSDTNPEIHSPNDTLEVSDNNASHAVKFARLSTVYVAELAKGQLGPPANMEPTIAITAPVDQETMIGSVMLAAMASDPEDGDLGTGIRWSSDRDGELGTGAAHTVALSQGTHAITAAVTDSRAATASTSITITVRSPNGDGEPDAGSGGCATGQPVGLGLALLALAYRRRRTCR